VTVNSAIMHFANPAPPFGGIGESGMGAYHGEAGVRVFQHHEPVLQRSTRPDPSVAYPPFNQLKKRLPRRLL